MQRDRLICTLIGGIVAKNPNIEAIDAQIIIDQKLIAAHFTPLGSEPNDAEIIQEAIDEMKIYVIGKGINRAARRKNL